MRVASPRPLIGGIWGGASFVFVGSVALFSFSLTWKKCQKYAVARWANSSSPIVISQNRVNDFATILNTRRNDKKCLCMYYCLWISQTFYNTLLAGKEFYKQDYDH